MRARSLSPSIKLMEAVNFDQIRSSILKAININNTLLLRVDLPLATALTRRTEQKFVSGLDHKHVIIK